MLRRLFFKLGIPVLVFFAIAEAIIHPERFPFVLTAIILLIYLLLFLFVRKQRDEYKVFIYSYLPILLLGNVLPKVLFAFEVIKETSILLKISWTFDVILFTLLSLIVAQKLNGKRIIQTIYFIIIFGLAMLFLISIWFNKAGVVNSYVISVVAFLAYLAYDYFSN